MHVLGLLYLYQCNCNQSPKDWSGAVFQNIVYMKYTSGNEQYPTSVVITNLRGTNCCCSFVQNNGSFIGQGQGQL